MIIRLTQRIPENVTRVKTKTVFVVPIYRPITVSISDTTFGRGIVLNYAHSFADITRASRVLE